MISYSQSVRVLHRHISLLTYFTLKIKDFLKTNLMRYDPFPCITTLGFTYNKFPFREFSPNSVLRILGGIVECGLAPKPIKLNPLYNFLK